MERNGQGQTRRKTARGRKWRKREGIEPTGDISASRPDLKSGGATSAPSASVVEGASPRPHGEVASPGGGRFLPATLPRLRFPVPAAPDLACPFGRHRHPVPPSVVGGGVIITERKGETMR